MSAAEDLVLAEARVAEVELAMLDADAAGLERLKAERLEAVAWRDGAELRAAAEARARSRPNAWQLWREFEQIKFIRRSSLTQEQQRRLIAKFGRAFSLLPP